jgi:hypothetical protein
MERTNAPKVGTFETERKKKVSFSYVPLWM